MLIESLLENIKKEEKDREWMNPLRMSSAGNCQRKIAYQVHGYTPKPLTPRARMVFRLGDIIEAELKSLFEKYKIDKQFDITYPKEAYYFAIDDTVILGHVDGIIGSPKKMILEIKSINDRGYKQLKTEGVSYGYKCQANAYMHAKKIYTTLFIFYNKNTSHVQEIEVVYDPKLYEEIKNRFKLVITSTKDKLPDREYGPLDTGYLPYNCSYCPFVDHCWPKAEFTVTKTGYPLYKING